MAECVEKRNCNMEAASSEFSDTLVLNNEQVPAAVVSEVEDGQTLDDDRDPSPVSSASAEDASGLTTAHEKKEAAKARRREDKAIEAVLKALSSLDSTEEKLAALCKKYADLLEENRLLQHKFKQSQRSLTVIMKEKDQLQSEHSKAVLAKSKLESLCRELQRHNKLIKEESVARAKDEEEKRKEVTSKFQTTINDIQQQMNDHYQKNTKLREENVELVQKLKNLMEQYDLREQHMNKLFKHKELEQELADAKLAQVNLQITQHTEQNQHEKAQLLAEAQAYQQKITVLEEQEKHLRAQVAMYTEKYEEFQQTLSKSNDVFQSFKSEMDKMTKKIKKLEKETVMWRSRWENSNKALLQMAEEKTHSDKHIATLNNKQTKLENLCRALQEERRSKNTPNGVVAKEQVQKEAGEVEPTETPPNTPDQSSRASPVTVQPETLPPSPPAADNTGPETTNDVKEEPADQESANEEPANEESANEEPADEVQEEGKEAEVEKEVGASDEKEQDNIEK